MLLRIDSDIGTSILSYLALVDLSCLVQTCQGFATYLLQSNDDNEEKEGTTTQVSKEIKSASSKQAFDMYIYLQYIVNDTTASASCAAPFQSNIPPHPLYLSYTDIHRLQQAVIPVRIWSLALRVATAQY